MTIVTEILELYRYVGDTEAAEVALTELINESYSSVSFASPTSIAKSSRDMFYTKRWALNTQNRII